MANGAIFGPSPGNDLLTAEIGFEQKPLSSSVSHYSGRHCNAVLLFHTRAGSAAGEGGD